MFFQEMLLFCKNHLVLMLIWCFLLIIILYIFYMNWMYSGFKISCEKAVFLINKKGAVVVDMRNSEEYYSGYIVNSINISIKDIKENDFILGSRLKNNPLILVYNSSDRFLYSVKKDLNRLGFTQVYVLEGGISSWVDGGFPLLNLKK